MSTVNLFHESMYLLIELMDLRNSPVCLQLLVQDLHSVDRASATLHLERAIEELLVICSAVIGAQHAGSGLFQRT